MHHRLICVLLAALMPFLLAAPVFAQEGAPALPVLCGDLPGEDCAILEEATLAAQDLSSYAMDMTLDFSMAGIPDLPADPLAFSINFGGRFAFDETGQAVIERMSLLQTAAAEADMQALLEEMPDMVVDLYRGMNFDMTMTYMLPPELAAALSDDSDVAFPEEMSFDMRMIDGMMYINIGQLRDLIPEGEDDGSITSDWIGMDYAGMIEMQMESGAGEMDEAMMAGVAGGLAWVQLLQQMQEYVAVERLADVEIDGRQAAVFTYTPDVIGFLSSDAFVEMMRELGAMAGEAGASEAELEEAATMISFVAPMIFRDLEVGASTTIGLEDYMTYSTEFRFFWDLASLMQFAAMTDPALAESMGDAEPLIELNAAVDMSDFNAEMEFAVPDDVQIIPLEELMPVDTSTVS